MAVLESLLARWWVTYSTYPHFPGPRVLSIFAEPHFDGDKKRSNVANRAQNSVYCLAYVGHSVVPDGDA
jgi:hypothetical protein